MNDLVVAEKIAQWQRLKALVLDSVSSPITKRVYSMALDEFLTSPRKDVPGTKMTFAGLPKPADRADLIAWLRQQSDSPVPLP